MTQSTSCPDSAELKELLDGTLPEKEQAELHNHLETCPHCQQRLETLVAGKESWSGTAEQLSQQEQGPDLNLERIMDQLRNEGPARQTETESPSTDEWTLHFLSPPENPEHLGRLGHYEVTQVLGRGGMGIVLKAFDAALHRVVAIKVLAPQLATSPAARKRFEREARAAAAISHEHIVAIYAVEESMGLPYLVMEYVAGVSLQDRLDRSGPLELKEILRIGMQTAKGLAAAHAQGLVHRDIKPANILLHNGVERVKITDFGLARAIDDASLTQSGYVAGTPQYMAPEQARGEAVDHRADLFSLGSVLYALCAGRPPFRASTAMAVLRRVSEESPQPLAEINPEIPLWLAQIIDKLHAKSPADRFQSAQEVADLLGEQLAQLQQPGAASVERRAQRAERIPIGASRSALRAPRFRRLKVAALFLPLIAGGLVLTEATGLTKVKEWVATVLRIPTPEGTLIVEIDDPQVQVTVDGEELAIHGAGPQEIRVKPGQHRIQAMKDGKPVPVDKDLVTISRGDKQIVRVRQEGTNQNQVLGKARETAEITTHIQHPDPIRGVSFFADGRISILAGNHTDPHQLAEAIRKLLGEAGRVVTIDVLPAPTSLLMLRANAEQTERIKEIISKLDKEQLPDAWVEEAWVQHPRQIEAAPSQQIVGQLAAPQGDPIGITFSVGEASFLAYQRLMKQQKGFGLGSPLDIRLANERDFAHEGRLVGFSDHFDSKTRTVQAEGSMPNPDRLLLPGMSVWVRMSFGPPRRFLEVPEQAVLNDLDGSYVLVVSDKDIVERRAVELGGRVVNAKDLRGQNIVDSSGAGTMRIIEKGLDAGDWIAVGKTGQTRTQELPGFLRPGTRVKRRIIDEKTTTHSK